MILGWILRDFFQKNPINQSGFHCGSLDYSFDSVVDPLKRCWCKSWVTENLVPEKDFKGEPHYGSKLHQQRCDVSPTMKDFSQASSPGNSLDGRDPVNQLRTKKGKIFWKKISSCLEF